MHVSALLTLLPFVSLVAGAVEKRSFDISGHLGNLSPYSAAPAAPGISADLPADCSVEQVMLVRFDYLSSLLFDSVFCAKRSCGD
jgi:hypothetical protein